MKYKLAITTILVLIILSACGGATPTPAPTQDINIVYTSAAYTVVAEFTLTAAAFTPTSAPPTETPVLEPPTATPTASEVPAVVVTNAQGTPIELCDKYSWNSATVDVNYPDDTEVTAGQDFTKTWKIKNIGACTWGAGYKLIYAGYTVEMSGKPQPLPSTVAPGEEIEVSIQFKAPTKSGVFISAWTVANDKGISFFGNDNKPLYVKIVVK